jgi:hypothetical protein
MKIIRHRPSRRPERLDWAEAVLERRPKKRGLLIGIQYENDTEDSDDDEANALRGPHQDVAAMRALLIGEWYCHRQGARVLTSDIDYYGYDADNIVVLIDRDEEGQMQPTRANMVRIGGNYTVSSVLFNTGSFPPVAGNQETGGRCSVRRSFLFPLCVELCSFF